jgi:putative flavoprotein involved in K+ transport
MAELGIRLLGRIDRVEGEKVILAPGLAATLDRVAAVFGERLQPSIDRYIVAAGEDAPPDDNAWSSYAPPELETVDLRRAGISSVIWTSGFRPDYSWIDGPVTDDMGLPRAARGVSDVPGLFFAGALWQTNQVSATLFGPHVDGRHVAGAMGLTLPDEEPLIV